jgi:hypothetical protein
VMEDVDRKVRGGSESEQAYSISALYARDA